MARTRYRPVEDSPAGMWSLATYPNPDPTLVDNRPQELAEEHLYELRHGSWHLAVAAGESYAAEDRPELKSARQIAAIERRRRR
jgi:hypothetical protein